MSAKPQFTDLPFDTFRSILLKMDCKTLVNMWNSYKFENYFEDELSTYYFWIQYLNKLTTYEIYYSEYEKYSEYEDEDRGRVIEEIKEHSQILCYLNNIIQKDVYTTLIGTGILELIKDNAMDDSFMQRDNLNLNNVLGDNILYSMNIYFQNMSATLYELLKQEYINERAPVDDTIVIIFSYYIRKQGRYTPLSINYQYFSQEEFEELRDENIKIVHQSVMNITTLDLFHILELYQIYEMDKEALDKTLEAAYVYYSTEKISKEDFRDKLDKFLDFFMEKYKLEGFNYDIEQSGENKSKEINLDEQNEYWLYIEERLGGSLS